MRSRVSALVLAVALLASYGCGPSKDDMEAKQTYSLCQKTDASRQILYGQLKALADVQSAQFIDRSEEVGQELSDLKSDVLKDTGGRPLLLMVEKKDQFRVSVTNLGLTQKIALTIRSRRATGTKTAMADFLNNLGRFWAIESVEGSVQNDPPCK